MFCCLVLSCLIFCVVLCRVVLCCVVLFCFASCCIVLWCIILPDHTSIAAYAHVSSPSFVLLKIDVNVQS